MKYHKKGGKLKGFQYPYLHPPGPVPDTGSANAMPTPIRELTNPLRLKAAPGATDRAGEVRTKAPVMTRTRNKRAIFFPKTIHLLKLR